jgi:DNA replication protein
MSTKSFTGFPGKAEVTPIPTLFLTSIMPRIDDMAELKTVLHIFRLLSRRRGFPRFVTFTELSNDTALAESIASASTSDMNITLGQALNLAVDHGILLHLTFNKDGKTEDIYLINTEADKKIVEKIAHGEFALAGSTTAKQIGAQPAKMPDIFTLYEQNIGILTPIIAEELQEAEKRYPPDWIEDAFRAAVSLNKRNWKYITRILERWSAEGKDNGALRRNTKKESDPDKYIKGKYGHMVQR